MKISMFILSVFVVISCFNLYGQNQSGSLSQKANKTTSSKIILLSSRPKPKIVNVPKISGSSYVYEYGDGSSKTITLFPPVTNVLKQSSPESQGFGQFISYTTDNGLALDPVTCGYKDNLGNLWFGTSGGGVSRYDGKSFTNFTTAQGLAYNTVCCITQDRNGNLWFGTYGGGVSCYNGVFFKNFTTEQGLVSNDVYGVAEDNSGNMWFTTVGGGISKYDGKTFTNFTTKEGLPNNVVLCVTKDKDGNLWFGFDGDGVCRYDGKSFSTITKKDGLPNDRIWCITEDKKGNLWFGSFNGGVSRYDGKTFTNFSTKQGLAYNWVRSMHEDRFGNLWFGTYGGGVSRFDGKTFTNFTTANGIANDIIYGITEDNAGGLWFSTYGGGVTRYDGKAFVNFTTNHGLAKNNIRCIYEDKSGVLWFGTEGGGASRYDGKSFENYTLEQGLASVNVWSITEDNFGNLWFGTDQGGVSCFTKKSSSREQESFANFTTKQGLPSNVILCSKTDKLGNLWFGTEQDGVSRFDGKSFTNYTEEQGLANNSVWSICEDKKGNIWFGTDGGGVSRFDGKSFTNYGDKEGLRSSSVWSVAEDSTGNIWLGTEGGGVVRYDGKSFMSITTKEGLPDNVVTQIAFYHNKIIFGTNNGIAVLTSFKVKNSQNTNSKTIENQEVFPQNNLDNSILQDYSPEFKIYNASTGYPVKDVNVGCNAMYLDSKGILWAATGNNKTALVRIDLKAIHNNEEVPKVVLQNLKVNSENICWHVLKSSPNSTSTDSLAILNEEKITFGKLLDETTTNQMIKKFGDIGFDSIDSFYPMPINLVLPYKHNNITFEFAAIEPSKPYLIKYQHKLEGYDVDWSPITNSTSASFGNIYEGTYTFKVKACSPDGIWSNPILYTFKVLPPWYRTWYMYCLYTIAVIGALYLIYRWRVAQLHKEKEILEEKIELRTEQLKHANEELQAMNEEINTQMNIIEHKNTNITSSIQYAKIIQRAVFPSLDKLEAYFDQYFVLFSPKDIVSGDFYYAKQKGKHLFIAAADCTGHGVPGAFMSVLGISHLNEVISKGVLTKPNEILNELRIRIKKSLHQEKKKGQTQDGMDIALCTLDIENTTIQYAGAHCPLYIIRKNETNFELIEFKADLMPIGVHPKDEKSFTNYDIQLQHGDTLYLFTDGYVSQTGGTNFETFKRKRFQEILLNIQEHTLDEQKQILEQTLTNWQGNYDQVDDILIIGMRYNDSSV